MPDKKNNVLIVEDSPFFSQWISRQLLNLEGIEVAGIVDNVNDAIRFIKDKPINIAIIDVMLNNSVGTELIKYLKSFNENITVILFTNYPELKKNCLNLGADYFFDKSTEYDEMINVVSNLNNNVY
jgi:DNA-binding NtrC family response regulator